MTREHKLALIVGFALVLVLGVLISDHFSKARQAQMAGAGDIRPPTLREVGAGSGVAMLNTEHATAPQPTTDIARPELPGIARAPVGDANRASTTQVAAGQIPNSPLAAVNGGTGWLPYGDHGESPTGPTPPPIAPPIPMTRYEVKEGDTLYGIAQKTYGEGKLWEKIRDSNRDKLGSGGTLRKGVTLLLPPKEVLLGKPYAPPTQPNPASNARGASTDSVARPDAKTPGDYREYQVKDGDTLVAIARKMLNSGRRYPEIIDANKGTLADPEALTVGMKLRIPAK